MSKDSTIKSMKVSVVIPVYNEEDYIADCLKRIVKQQEPADEIIIVDNNSTDKTIEIAKTFPGITIVKEKTQGMIPARNKGFNTAKYEIIAKPDADTRVPPDWIKRIKQNFQETSTIAVSGPVSFYDGLPGLQTLEWPSKILFFKLLKQTLKHDCLFGPNYALRKSAWEKVQDEVCLEDKHVHEDIDLSLHLAFWGEIKFDKQLVVSVSFRRYKKFKTYFEYPYREIKTIRRHRKTLIEIKSKRIVKKVFSKSKTWMKQLQKFPDQI